MDELFFNKIAAAVLGTALAFMGIRALSSSLVTTPEITSFAYAPELTIEGPAEEEVDLPFPQPEWIAAMDAAKGKKAFAKCKSCHNNEKGGSNGTGPNLYGIVGNQAGKQAGFAYSSVITDSGVTWDFAALDAFLTKPKDYLPGSKMIFNGIKKPEQRAALIEYLRVADDSPLPQPAPAATSAEAIDDAGTPSDDAPMEDAPTEDAPMEDAPQ